MFSISSVHFGEVYATVLDYSLRCNTSCLLDVTIPPRFVYCRWFYATSNIDHIRSVTVVRTENILISFLSFSATFKGGKPSILWFTWFDSRNSDLIVLLSAVLVEDTDKVKIIKVIPLCEFDSDKCFSVL